MALVGIECGDTRTTVAASAAADSTDPAVSFELGPANFRLTSSDQYGALFTEAFSRLGAQQPPAAVGLAVAGARHAAQHAELAVARTRIQEDMAGGAQAYGAIAQVRRTPTCQVGPEVG